MAKLSARGRREVWRLVKESTLTEADSSYWVRRKVEYAYMTDRHILKREVCWSKNRFYRPDGPANGPEFDRHDFGWKDKGKAKSPEHAETFRKKLLELGWTEKRFLRTS